MRPCRADAMTDGLNRERIEQALRTAWIGTRLIYDEVTDSTNTTAMRMARDGAPHGTLVVADRQESGRGRRGRSWEMAAGEAVAMSLILKPKELKPANAPMLTLVAALAAADAIRDICGSDVQIKWPNDLVSGGKKLCGILTEMQVASDGSAMIVVGIGINVNNTQFAGEIRETATSLYQCFGRKYDRAELIGAVCERFEHFFSVFMQTQDLCALRERYERSLVNRNRSVRVLDPKGAYDGTARGIAPDGALIVETADGLRHVDSGEVSVRGVYGYV